MKTLTIIIFLIISGAALLLNGTTSFALTAPTVTYPNNCINSGDIGTGIKISWDDSSVWLAEISTSSNFSSSYIKYSPDLSPFPTTNTDGTGFLLNGLSDNLSFDPDLKTYYVRVINNVSGKYNTSPTKDFKPPSCSGAVSKPPTPTVTAPYCLYNPDKGNKIVISWTANSTAVTHVDISTNSSFSTYYRKAIVSGSTSTSGDGFSLGGNQIDYLKYSPTQTYYVRTVNKPTSGSETYSDGYFTFTPPLTSACTGTCSASPTNPNTNQAVTWTAYPPTNDGYTTGRTYSWIDITNPLNAVPLSSNSQTVSKSYTTAGTLLYKVSMTVESGFIEPSCSVDITNSPGPAGPCPVQAARPRVRKGLISAPDVGINFGNDSGQCVNSNQAAFAPFKIPDYNDLKSIYYTRSKAPKQLFDFAGAGYPTKITSITDGNVYNYKSQNGASIGPIDGYNQTALFFIDKNLDINDNITTSADKGLVFVVGGDINIAPNVTRIDAVLISSGRIYTAGSGCVKNGVKKLSSGYPIQSLTVNGSLVSLDPEKSIVFCRELDDNSTPAEVINYQPKYLVILRNLYSDTVQKWAEMPN